MSAIIFLIAICYVAYIIHLFYSKSVPSFPLPTYFALICLLCAGLIGMSYLILDRCSDLRIGLIFGFYLVGLIAWGEGSIKRFKKEVISL